jgi:hypothetical protein
MNETRIPKAEGRKKSEVRSTKSEGNRSEANLLSSCLAHDLAKRLDCGDSSPLCRASGRTRTPLRISAFLRPSDPALRISALGIHTSNFKLQTWSDPPSRATAIAPAPSAVSHTSAGAGLPQVLTGGEIDGHSHHRGGGSRRRRRHSYQPTGEALGKPSPPRTRRPTACLNFGERMNWRRRREGLMPA